MGEKKHGYRMVAVRVNEQLSAKKFFSLIHKASTPRNLGLWIMIMMFVSKQIYDYMDDEQKEMRKEVLVSMCYQRGRMLQDQFSVSVNHFHVHALAILVSTFHYYKNPSAIDQITYFPAHHKHFLLENPASLSPKISWKLLASFVGYTQDIENDLAKTNLETLRVCRHQKSLEKLNDRIYEIVASNNSSEIQGPKQSKDLDPKLSKHLEDVYECGPPDMKFAGSIKNQYYSQTQFDEVRSKWSEFIYYYVGS